MWAAIGSILLGVLGWTVTSFVAKPIIDFLELRRKVHEELVYTGNIGLMDLQNAERREKFEEAVERLRRLGAQVQAMDVGMISLVRKILVWTGFNLTQSGRGLIGLSNSLHTQDGSRALHSYAIEKAFKLPSDYTAEMIEDIRKRTSRGI